MLGELNKESSLGFRDKANRLLTLLLTCQDTALTVTVSDCLI